MLRSRQRQVPMTREASGYQRIQTNVRGIERVKALWMHLVLGCTLMSGGVWLLMWSEGKLLQKTLSLDEGLQSIISIYDPSDAVLPSNEGKLVHVVGPLEMGEPLTEFEYGVSIPTIKLKRRIQMYQWVEEKTIRESETEIPFQSDGLAETSYFYFTEWRDKLIDSSMFMQQYGHENPKEFPFKTVTYVSEHVNIGGYYFNQGLKDLFTDFILVTSDERPERRDIKLHSGLYYHSQDVWNPEVGDIRVQFSYAGLAGEVVTVVAKQVKHELHPFQTKSGHDILIMRQGRYSISEIFQEEHKQNWFLSWSLRVSCGILLFVGASFLTRMLKDIGNSQTNSWVFRYSSVRDLLTKHSGSVNFSISASISFSIVALTWISFKPVMGAFLLCAAILPLIFCLANMCFNSENKNPYRQI